MDAADIASVFYLPESVAIKKLDPVNPEQILEAFERTDLKIFTDASDFKDFIFTQDYADCVLLLMSSGNYGMLDLKAVGELVSGAKNRQ